METFHIEPNLERDWSRRYPAVAGFMLHRMQRRVSELWEEEDKRRICMHATVQMFDSAKNM